MANLTGDGNQTLEALPAGVVEFFSALNVFLSIIASLGNALILVALHKVSSIHPPTKLFFRCLAVTDLCVGLFIQPLYATYIMSHIIKMNTNVLSYVYEVNRAFGWIVCGVSGLTSTGISVDRLLALLLGLRYRHVVTLTRVCVVIICFWLIGASLGWIRMWRRDIALMVTSFLITFCVVTSIYSHTRIHCKLRHQQAQVQNHVPQGPLNGGEIPLNIARYKKTVSSIMWVQLALAACYIPYSIVAVLDVNGVKNYVATFTTETLVYLNSSVNSILYCWKIKEVRQAVKNTIRQLICF